MESVTYRVQPDEQDSWHILGPLPPPHLFANRVDIDAIRRSLSDGGANFLANSVFVWQMFQSAGWNVPFESTGDLLSGATYRTVDNRQAGRSRRLSARRGAVPCRVARSQGPGGVLDAECWDHPHHRRGISG